MTTDQRQAIMDGLKNMTTAIDPEQEPPNIDRMRAEFARMVSTMQIPAGIKQSPTRLAGRPAVLVEPEDQEPKPGTILYFHGGSFMIGSPATAMSLTASLVKETGVSALSLDYRLAPEHPFPAGIEDALAAYRELLDRGSDPTSIVFAGDSAGGGIAVGACLAAKQAGLPMPAGLVGFSASLDASRTGASLETKSGRDPFFTADSLRWNASIYLDGQDPHQAWASPATCGDLAGLPPVLLQVGTEELLLDDSTRFAERAREAGVDVILDVTGNVAHVFQTFAGQLDAADEALARAGFFIRQRVSGADIT
ncbi:MULTISPECIES: alpha/beta hydrolase [Micrococcaceae]|uniref:alpha/beta hydrolase n=1 Tax=unclassified Kocuria TaxID=2649579 RepID=UPI001013440A|nr:MULTISPECIES: alpha/beta hydrolase [unclassified Kocuria]